MLPYDPAFEMGATLAEAARADGGMFERGAVKLCHPHCAKFCVLGGGAGVRGAPPPRGEPLAERRPLAVYDEVTS